jgi:YHS domain-containing protein
MKKLIVLFSFVSLIYSCEAQKNGKTIFATKQGAIKGYDPVAYFTEKKPVKGLENITFSWQGAVWHFVSAENRDLFQKMPEKYAPQYGGWCAYGWAQGYPAKIEPEAWRIVDGKLYLNYDVSVQKMWQDKQAEFIEKADKNYSNRKQ